MDKSLKKDITKNLVVFERYQSTIIQMHGLPAWTVFYSDI